MNPYGQARDTEPGAGEGCAPSASGCQRKARDRDQEDEDWQLVTPLRAREHPDGGESMSKDNQPQPVPPPLPPASVQYETKEAGGRETEQR